MAGSFFISTLCGDGHLTGRRFFVPRGRNMNQDDEIDAYIERLVADAPPLTEETIARLSVVLAPVRMEGVA